MKFKICGMKYPENIMDVAAMQPDYLGFIFYKKSKRNFEGAIPNISDHTKRTGVFVNASKEFILEKVKQYDLKAIQLHGDESPQFCKELLNNLIEIIKVFSVGEKFDFDVLQEYQDVCNYFLFDTKGKNKGGNGIVFNWKLLKNYTSKKPYFLSGGIGLEEFNELKEFFNTKASKYCYAIDVNSKFEIEPGLKDVKKLKKFKQSLEKGV
ncbi:MAG: phosphoribosylanthranilate isomerase [Flavobacteriaceae bacterium]|nr:phosphoribosylanthranilate isomerase [Flavobacteriaceae bacterium]